MKNYKNPFKNKDFKNPGKTIKESEERVSNKVKRIKELMKNTDVEYFNFSIEKMEESMKGDPETMPEINSVEELDEWLIRKG